MCNCHTARRPLSASWSENIGELTLLVHVLCFLLSAISGRMERQNYTPGRHHVALHGHEKATGHQAEHVVVCHAVDAVQSLAYSWITLTLDASGLMHQVQAWPCVS